MPYRGFLLFLPGSQGICHLAPGSLPLLIPTSPATEPSFTQTTPCGVLFFASVVSSPTPISSTGSTDHLQVALATPHSLPPHHINGESTLASHLPRHWFKLSSGPLCRLNEIILVGGLAEWHEVSTEEMLAITTLALNPPYKSDLLGLACEIFHDLAPVCSTHFGPMSQPQPHRTRF